MVWSLLRKPFRTKEGAGVKQVANTCKKKNKKEQLELEDKILCGIPHNLRTSISVDSRLPTGKIHLALRSEARGASRLSKCIHSR